MQSISLTNPMAYRRFRRHVDARHETQFIYGKFRLSSTPARTSNFRKKCQPEETQGARSLSRLPYIISSTSPAVLAVIEPFDLASRYLKPQREYLPTYLRKRLYLGRHMRFVLRIPGAFIIFLQHLCPRGSFSRLAFELAKTIIASFFFSHVFHLARLRFHSKIRWLIFAYYINVKYGCMILNP